MSAPHELVKMCVEDICCPVFLKADTKVKHSNITIFWNKKKCVDMQKEKIKQSDQIKLSFSGNKIVLKLQYFF